MILSSKLHALWGLAVDCQESCQVISGGDVMRVHLFWGFAAAWWTNSLQRPDTIHLSHNERELLFIRRWELARGFYQWGRKVPSSRRIKTLFALRIRCHCELVLQVNRIQSKCSCRKWDIVRRWMNLLASWKSECRFASVCISQETGSKRSSEMDCRFLKTEALICLSLGVIFVSAVCRIFGFFDVFSFDILKSLNGIWPNAARKPSSKTPWLTFNLIMKLFFPSAKQFTKLENPASRVKLNVFFSCPRIKWI